MFDIDRLMLNLKRRERLFHIEADFQYAFACELHEMNSPSDVRVEFRFPKLQGKPYVDIRVQTDSVVVVFELKYCTKKLMLPLGSGGLALTNWGVRRSVLSFLKDIERLETIINGHEANRGYAVLLTNENRLWEEPHFGDKYPVQWQDYYQVRDKLAGRFRYFVVQVLPQ